MWWDEIFGERRYRIEKNKKIPERPGWDRHFLKLAADYSLRATCLRRQYGAIIVDTKKRLVSAGYCGAPRGVNNCLERGECYRRIYNIPSGEKYELCMSIHAEENAILFCDDKNRLEGATLYLAGWDVEKEMPSFSPPCILCAKKIIQVGIEKIVLFEQNGGVRTIEVSTIADKLSKGDFSYPY
ncbi:MAG: dCMP deaminase family protein [Candidatus Woesearchaeota archaeon]